MSLEHRHCMEKAITDKICPFLRLRFMRIPPIYLEVSVMLASISLYEIWKRLSIGKQNKYSLFTLFDMNKKCLLISKHFVHIVRIPGGYSPSTFSKNSRRFSSRSSVSTSRPSMVAYSHVPAKGMRAAVIS